MRMFYDKEHENFVTETELREEFFELLSDSNTAEEYENISFVEYINNCLTENDGTLEEIHKGEPEEKTIAERINTVVYDYDTYGYYDCYDDFEQGVNAVEELLRDDVGKETIIITLKEIIEDMEEYNQEMTEEAEALINILRNGA